MCVCVGVGVRAAVLRGAQSVWTFTQFTSKSCVGTQQKKRALGKEKKKRMALAKSVPWPALRATHAPADTTHAPPNTSRKLKTTVLPACSESKVNRGPSQKFHAYFQKIPSLHQTNVMLATHYSLLAVHCSV